MALNCNFCSLEAQRRSRAETDDQQLHPDYPPSHKQGYPSTPPVLKLMVLGRNYHFFGAQRHSRTGWAGVHQFHLHSTLPFHRQDYLTTPPPLLH